MQKHHVELAHVSRRHVTSSDLTFSRKLVSWVNHYLFDEKVLRFFRKNPVLKPIHLRIVLAARKVEVGEILFGKIQ